MIWLQNVDSAVTIAAFLTAAFSVLIALRVCRIAHQRRLHEFDTASELLREHFAAAKQLANDPATPDSILGFIKLISQCMGHREVAQRMALASKAARKEPSKEAALFIAKIQDDVRALQKHRPDLVYDLATVVRSGIIAMLLRWPETEAVAVKFAAPVSEPIRAIKEQSSRVLMAAPDELHEKLCAA